MKIRLFLFAAGLALAGAFILSCSSDDGGGGGSGGDQQSYSYCLYIDAQVCVAGLYKDCPAGGIPSNSCPYGDVEPSSSSGEQGISSGEAASSSSEAESSSSSVPSSSSLGGGYTGSYGSLPYGGQTYKTVVIGTQTWMAENLNYAAEGSKCYSNLDSNCDTYGRLYNWATAMGFESSCNSSYCSSQINSPHRGICPSGWHIPSDADWTTLTNYADYAGSSAGTKLKAESGWNDYDGASGNGTDAFGFSALPGGVDYSSGSFYDVGDLGIWWSATEYDAIDAYGRYMGYGYAGVSRRSYYKSYLYSVRCVQD